MKNRVLFVTERFCDGTPNLGWTNNFHNLFNTFSHSQGQKYNWNAIHLDEAAVVYQTHIDKILPRYCLQWDVNIIIYSLLGQSPVNPSLQCYQQLKSLGIYQCFMWPDTGPGWGMQTIQEFGDIPDMHVSWDNPKSAFHDSIKKRDNHLFLWVPQDKTLYFKQEQDIPASFIGSLRYNDRAIYCSYLQECLKDVLITGGQREKKFPPEDYASLIRRSKIGINFSASPAGFWQTKGRIFEILASGSMLVESANPSTRLLFEPNKEYIEFYSPEDLVEKVKYYMTHENERLAIAEAGYQAFQQKYTSKIFWDTIMNKINP